MPEPRKVLKQDKSHTEGKDPLIRSLVLLGLIPRYPRSATVQELRDELDRRGFRVTTRTLQRDLGDKLSRRFPIFCSDVAESHLRTLLPPGVLDLLEPQFVEAREVRAMTLRPKGPASRRHSTNLETEQIIRVVQEQPVKHGFPSKS